MDGDRIDHARADGDPGTFILQAVMEIPRRNPLATWSLATTGTRRRSTPG
jgi:hypothetical protein